MEEPNKTISALVKNKIKNGYRRAGISLQQGDNLLENLTFEQLEQLKSDARLVVQTVFEKGGESGAKWLPENGETAPPQTEQLSEGVLPADLTVEQLKAKLKELNVKFAKEAKKADLVALLESAGEGK